MLVDVVAEPVRDPVDRALETRVGEGLHLAAVAADQMMVMVAVGRRWFVASDPVSGVHSLHEP